jgi:hypothetical protein
MIPHQERNQDMNQPSMIQQLRQAEVQGDWHKVKLCLLRLDLVKRGYDKPCPHCGVILTGVGAWPDTLSTPAWVALVAVYVKGYIYRCNYIPLNGSKDGCGGLFLSIFRR